MVLLYVVFVVGLGFYFAKRTATTEDYFLAGRSLVWWLIGFSLLSPSTTTNGWRPSSWSCFWSSFSRFT